MVGRAQPVFSVTGLPSRFAKLCNQADFALVRKLRSFATSSQKANYFGNGIFVPRIGHAAQIDAHVGRQAQEFAQASSSGADTNPTTVVAIFIPHFLIFIVPTEPTMDVSQFTHRAFDK